MTENQFVNLLIQEVQGCRADVQGVEDRLGQKIDDWRREQNGRIRSLEQSRAKAAGVVAAATVTASALATIVAVFTPSLL